MIWEDNYCIEGRKYNYSKVEYCFKSQKRRILKTREEIL